MKWGKTQVSSPHSSVALPSKMPLKSLFLNLHVKSLLIIYIIICFAVFAFWCVSFWWSSRLTFSARWAFTFVSQTENEGQGGSTDPWWGSPVAPQNPSQASPSWFLSFCLLSLLLWAIWLASLWLLHLCPPRRSSRWEKLQVGSPALSFLLPAGFVCRRPEGKTELWLSACFFAAAAARAGAAAAGAAAPPGAGAAARRAPAPPAAAHRGLSRRGRGWEPAEDPAANENFRGSPGHPPEFHPRRRPVPGRRGHPDSVRAAWPAQVHHHQVLSEPAVLSEAPRQTEGQLRLGGGCGRIQGRGVA